MRQETALYVMTPETDDAVISQAAEDAAQDHIHLSCLLLAPAPILPIYAYGVPPYGGMNVPDNWGELVEAAHRELTERVNAVEGLLARSAVSADVQPVLCPTSDIRSHVARRARVCDMSYMAADLDSDGEIGREVAHGVLFQSPIGLILNSGPGIGANRVFLAWDGSAAAAKAAHLALPLMTGAQEVTVACFDPPMSAAGEAIDPGTDVATWLSHHGCHVNVSQFPSGGLEVAECIQNRANEIGADLVVMGAYGHARMLQAVFGGTTRTMIGQQDLALLLAH